MYRIFALFVVCLSATFTRAELPPDALVDALIRQESSGNNNAIGDKVDKYGKPRPPSEWAYGPLQIREVCIKDVNRRYGTHYRAKDCLGNRSLSIWVCRMYIQIYATQKSIGRAPTVEDMARIWNGGPKGWKRSSTKAYWTKVRKHVK